MERCSFPCGAGNGAQESDAGFSLVEVLVATALLVGALAAIAQLFLMAMDATRWSASTTLGTVLAAQKLEQLRSLAFIADEAGTPITDESSDLSVDPPSAAGGPGLRPSPPGALAANTPGCVDFLDQSGRWLGNGPAAPRGAAYVRRWSVTSLPAFPNDALVVQVHVARLPASSPTAAVQAGERVVSLISRRSR